MMNNQGRPTGVNGATNSETKGFATYTGSKGLSQVEGLIYEIGDTERTGVDLPEVEDFESFLSGA